jgi:ankyrin repeat protein
MPTSPLPENPSLENLRKRAKQLVGALRAGDATALALLREYHPRPPAEPALHDAQLVLARSYDFTSWSKLVHHVEGAVRHAWDPRTAPEPTNPADRMIRHACVDYGRWQLADRAIAERMLADDPALARASIHAAAAAGDVATVRALLDDRPALAGARGGPYGWPALLYACYSRLDRDTLGAARALLDAGADPDAGFLWCGNVPPFTALTGAFGDGETGNNIPPHPWRDELARALLDAGADPNDGQTLYNLHFHPDDGHLRLLFEYGLGTDRGGPWLARFGDRIGTPVDQLVEELWAAAGKNFADRVRLLVERGVPVDRPGRRDGRTPYEAAIRSGNLEIAAYLVAHGATAVDVPPEARLASAVIAGDRAAATALLASDPALRDRFGVHGRVEVVRRAVEARRAAGVRLAHELGFELDLPAGRTPMHEAAWSGDLEMVTLLVELGARTDVRDLEHDGTPLGWAAYNQQTAVVEYLTALGAAR